MRVLDLITIVLVGLTTVVAAWTAVYGFTRTRLRLMLSLGGTIAIAGALQLVASSAGASEGPPPLPTVPTAVSTAPEATPTPTPTNSPTNSVAPTTPAPNATASANPGPTGSHGYDPGAGPRSDGRGTGHRGGIPTSAPARPSRTTASTDAPAERPR
jgi:hypothetical protein